MKALLRYMLVKSAREHLLPRLLASPAVLICAPVAGLLVRQLILGRPVHPFAFEGSTHAATMRAFLNAGAVFAILNGAVGTFWILRKEITDRSISTFVLAVRPLTIWWVAIAYGTVGGVVAFLIALPLLAVLTWSALPPIAMLVASAALTTLAASSLAAALAAISPDLGMLVPLFFVTVILGAGVIDHVPAFLIIAAVLSLTLPLVAAFFLERRCAA